MKDFWKIWPCPGFVGLRGLLACTSEELRRGSKKKRPLDKNTDVDVDIDVDMDVDVDIDIM